MDSGRRPLAVSLAGVHGVGKTTVFRAIEDRGRLDADFFRERAIADPPVPFGSRDREIAFRSQVYFFQEMLARDRLVRGGSERTYAFLDRSPCCVVVYGSVLCDKTDRGILESLYLAHDFLEDVVVYLEGDPDVVAERSAGRGRPKSWNEDDGKYRVKISDAYDGFFDRFEDVGKKVKRLDVSDTTPDETAAEIERLVSKLVPKQL